MISVEEFNAVVDEQLVMCREMLVKKTEEYTDGVDPLHNFRSAESLMGSMTNALAGYMMKHTVSLYDMMKEDPNNFTPERWNEKITDHINYLLLLKAIVVEARSEKCTAACEEVC